VTDSHLRLVEDPPPITAETVATLLPDAQPHHLRLLMQVLEAPEGSTVMVIVQPSFSGLRIHPSAT